MAAMYSHCPYMMDDVVEKQVVRRQSSQVEPLALPSDLYDDCETMRLSRRASDECSSEEGASLRSPGQNCLPLSPGLSDLSDLSEARGTNKMRRFTLEHNLRVSTEHQEQLAFTFALQKQALQETQQPMQPMGVNVCPPVPDPTVMYMPCPVPQPVPVMATVMYRHDPYSAMAPFVSM